MGGREESVYFVTLLMLAPRIPAVEPAIESNKKKNFKKLINCILLAIIED